MPSRASSGHEDLSIGSYFVAQAHRPDEMWDVDIATLVAYQRALLVNDGAVTHLIEASVLEPLTVNVLEQRSAAVEDQLSSWIELPAGSSVLRRRVAICDRGSEHAYAFAESLLALSRLPSDFTSLLEHSAQGLGEALSRMRLETRRELLWFGYAGAPAWATPPASRQPLLTRSYRIILTGRPAILVTERFPLDDPARGGGY